MKILPTRYLQTTAYSVLCAGFLVALGACSTGSRASPTCCAAGQSIGADNFTLNPDSKNVQLAQNQTDGNEVYLGDNAPSKQEWINMLKLPEPTAGVTRGIHTEVKIKTPSLHVEFEKASASLTGQAKQKLETLGQAMADEMLKNQTFIIEGHTDSKGSAVYNQMLSEKRAASVKTFLTENFDIGDRRVKAIGLGKTHPLPGRSPEDPINRRVRIRPSH